jgi:hypothetical protein
MPYSRMKNAPNDVCGKDDGTIPTEFGRTLTPPGHDGQQGISVVDGLRSQSQGGGLGDLHFHRPEE